MKKTVLIVFLAIALVFGTAFVTVNAGVGGAFLSAFFGPGTGEFLTKEASVGSCCIEHLYLFVPAAGGLAYVGSILDNLDGTGGSRVNFLFTTVDLN